MSEELKNNAGEEASGVTPEAEIAEVAAATAEDAAETAMEASVVASAESGAPVEAVVEESVEVVVTDAAGAVVETAEITAVAVADAATGNVAVTEVVEVVAEPEREVRRGPSSYVESEGGRTSRIGSGVKAGDVDYKNIALLSRFLDRRGRILSRRKTRVSAKVQRKVAVAIKRARHLALLPYTADQTRTVRKRR
jgi:small subunit ribosomal protein S18